MYGLSILNILLWFKIITLGILFYYINNRKKNEFYYYKNLGLTKQILWTLTLLFDILLFVFLMVSTNIFR
jgi:type III secretory pathway component EscU